MRAEPPAPGASDSAELAHPGYWLVFGLEWPSSDDEGGGTGVAEAAVAVAPGLIPRDAVGSDAGQVLGCAHLYARKHRQRVVFFSDLTAMFAGAGTSWAQLGVDWENALRELREGPHPAMYLAVSERAYLLICDPVGRGPGAAGPGGWADEDGAEREVVRHAVAARLEADWPPWMNAMISAGRIRRAG